MPKISVIVPVYNSEKYLEKCLDSLVEQTLDDIEIIIVNDGSPDNSQDIIDRYVEKYPEKIKCFIQENKGQAAARNEGLKYINGEFVAFVDSDDYIEKDAYKTACNYAKENGFDIVCFGMYEENGDNRTVCDYTLIKSDKPDVRYVLNETSPCNKIVSSRIFKNHNVKFTENRIYEDLELIPQFALYTDKIGFMEDRLYNYVIHGNSTMRQPVYTEKLASIYAVMDTLKEKFSNTKYKDELEFLYIEHLLHGAVLRYLKYEEGTKDIKKIADIMKNTYPKWRKNKYYKTFGWKYKVMCNLAYAKQIRLLKKIFG